MVKTKPSKAEKICTKAERDRQRHALGKEKGAERQQQASIKTNKK